MKRPTPPEKDGDVSFYPADAQRLHSYDLAERQATSFQVPVFYHADHPHERLSIAGLDGTGHDLPRALHANPDLRNVEATIR